MLPLGGLGSGDGWRDADSSVYGSAHGSSGSDSSYIKVLLWVQGAITACTHCRASAAVTAQPTSCLLFAVELSCLQAWAMVLSVVRHS